MGEITTCSQFTRFLFEKLIVPLPVSSACARSCCIVPQEPAVLRYRMNGYSTSSVVPLPERDQILVNEAVESTVDGSLVVRFQRPLSPVITSKQDVCAPSTMGDKDEGNVGGCGVGIASAEASEGSMEWLDPRNESVVVLWAYSSRDYWPSYHDATGAFKLPADSWRK